MSAQSEQINELGAALAKAQGQMKAATKDTQNTFYKSTYADLAAIMSVCRGPLSANGLAVIQATDYNNEETWLETTLVHSSGQWVRSRYPIKPVKNDPQGVGSAHTYARRYSLMALVGIVATDEDDDGNAASRPNGNGAHPEPVPDKPDYKAIANKWADTALETLKTIKTSAELTAWHRESADRVAKLRGFNEAKHGRLVKAIQERTTELTTLNAG